MLMFIVAISAREKDKKEKEERKRKKEAKAAKKVREGWAEAAKDVSSSKEED